ncbi:MAG: hypothetical protein ACOCQG_06250 [Candidatus Nanoarchaeia archaeon]
MDYDSTITYLATELGVKQAQLEQSFNATKAFRGFDLREAEFSLEEKIPENYCHNCAAKIPLRIYEIRASSEEGVIKKAMTYNYEIMHNGSRKLKVTTSPPKTTYSGFWKIKEPEEDEDKGEDENSYRLDQLISRLSF